MQYKTTRKIARNIHIIVAVYQLLYIYSPLHNWQYSFTIVQFVAFPLLALSGFWLARGKKIWKRNKKSERKIVPTGENIQVLAPRRAALIEDYPSCEAPYSQSYTVQ